MRCRSLCEGFDGRNFGRSVEYQKPRKPGRTCCGSSKNAQSFGGLLSTLERTDATKTATERSFKASIWVATGEGKASKDSQQSSKQVVDPHDLIIADILTRLVGVASRDVKTAPNGSVIIAKGTILFFDHSMIEMGVEGLRVAFEEEQSKPKHKRDKNVITTNRIMGSLVDKLQTGSAGAERHVVSSERNSNYSHRHVSQAIGFEGFRP